MFAPNVWSFDSPNTQIAYKYSESNEKHEKQICKRIHSHPFNRVISIILPDTKAVPEAILPLLRDTDHYHISAVPLTEFIKKPFIEAFVKQGQFYGLSVDTRIDVDNCFGITPEGIFYLSITKDTYHRLGIQGKPSPFAKIHRNRYSIEINLKSAELATTTKQYARLQNALSNETLGTFTVRIAWEAPREKDVKKAICPSSIAKYFSDSGYDVELKQTECKTKLEYGLKMPTLGPESDDLVVINGQSNFYATPHELVEYAGMLALSCNLEPTEYLNTWSFSGHTVEVGSALIIRLKGLFSCNLVKMIFKKLRDYANQNVEIPWISLYVHGDPNSPVSFGGIEHSFTTNGDNSYAVFVSSNNKCLYYEFLSSNKALK
ncbi:ribonuclease P protein subunit p40 isoform X2 [Sitodiplosis mosellana]|uniref:ribonuclease P protein subunit p40 isoform X2 n=1 Tax=Sitodiplosis mosellana TaxID=263140 RepID=UPI0024437475|nr:ribonuclease P protein subunit p40 isoform X2 [Sitodiplosis mosellana]